MGIASTITGGVGLFRAVKEAHELANKLGRQDLKQKILDIQQGSLEMQEENLELKKQVAELKLENEKLLSAFKLKDSLRFGNHHYWLVDEDKKEVTGPYCVTCWETDQKKMSMIKVARGIFIMCPQCKNQMPGNRPPDEWGLKWQK